MGCKTDEWCNLKKKLGFRLYDVINTKEQTVSESKKKMHLKEKIYKQSIVF